MKLFWYDENSITNYIDSNIPKSINIIRINIRSDQKNLDEFSVNLERTKTKFQVHYLNGNMAQMPRRMQWNCWF